MRTFAVLVLVFGVLALGVESQGPVAREPQLQKTTAGSELYKFYCSTCHGLDAKGRPATPAMRVPAPDLTVLSLNNGGLYPRDRVREIIVEGTGSHGSSGMPVWGTIFRALEPTDAQVDERVDNLVRYIELAQTTVTRTHAQR
jgi:mono/diheme cytochrome c family protein